MKDTVADQRIQPLLRHDLDGSSEKILKIDNQAGRKPGAGDGACVYQEVHVALRARLTPGHGTEHTNVRGAMLGCDSENFGALRPDQLSGIEQLFHLSIS